jgi:hypothetical protein
MREQLTLSVFEVCRRKDDEHLVGPHVFRHRRGDLKSVTGFIASIRTGRMRASTPPRRASGLWKGRLKKGARPPPALVLPGEIPTRFLVARAETPPPLARTKAQAAGKRRQRPPLCVQLAFFWSCCRICSVRLGPALGKGVWGWWGVCSIWLRAKVPAQRLQLHHRRADIGAPGFKSLAPVLESSVLESSVSCPVHALVGDSVASSVQVPTFCPLRIAPVAIGTDRTEQRTTCCYQLGYVVSTRRAPPSHTTHHQQGTKPAGPKSRPKMCPLAAPIVGARCAMAVRDV